MSNEHDDIINDLTRYKINLSIWFPGGGFNLLFENSYEAHMWAEQWVLHHYNRGGEWEHDMFNMDSEYPLEYIPGVGIGTHHIPIHEHGKHDATDDRYCPKRKATT